MSVSPYLSLPAAIFVNINIMLGSGLFLNSVLLTQKAGALGAAVYPLVGLLILPLIWTFSMLLALIPRGTFYEFGMQVHPAVGFLGSWGYFIGKLASAGLSLHMFVYLMQKTNVFFASYPALAWDAAILAFFVFLLLFDVRTGRPMQYAFVCLKGIPILLVLYFSFRYFRLENFSPEALRFEGVGACVPLALFAFAGFEASCSLSKNIVESAKNGPRAIWWSYAIVLTVVTLYQLVLFGVFGMQLASCSDFAEPVRLLVGHVFGPPLRHIITAAAFFGIAASALGASYGMLYSNVWNLHTLATYRVIPLAAYFERKNRYFAPLWCVVIAGLIEFSYVFFTGGDILFLQRVAAMTSTFTYTVAACALLKMGRREGPKVFATAVLAVVSCLVLLGTTVSNALHFGFGAYILYAVLLALGLLSWYRITRCSCAYSPKSIE